MTDGTIDHIGIATSSLDESQQLWSILGFTQGEDQINSEEGVKIRFMNGNTSTRIELLEPLGDDTPVGKFISKYGPGIQQIAVRVADIEETVSVIISENQDTSIIIKSTVNIGYTASLQKKFSTSRIIFSPEFLREGHALEDNFFPSKRR